MRAIVFPEHEVGRVMALNDDGTLGRELAIARGTVHVDGPVVLRIEGDASFLRALPARALDGLVLERCDDPGSLAHSAHLELRVLVLDRLPITDAAVVSLARRTGLRHLRLAGTQITPDGFFVIRAALPECDVVGP